jgi:hypothetical protein
MPHAPPDPSRPRISGIIETSLYVDDLPAPWRFAWETHLRERGIGAESRLHWPHGGTNLYFRDPEGNSLEVATPGLWPNA